jgi:hypothetical protein
MTWFVPTPKINKIFEHAGEMVDSLVRVRPGDDGILAAKKVFVEVQKSILREAIYVNENSDSLHS